MRTTLDKLRNLANKAKEDLQIKLYNSGFESLEDYLDYIHNLESFESFHTVDDVLYQLDYYVNIQRKILNELEGIKFLEENK
jgi:hypothetical protein